MYRDPSGLDYIPWLDRYTCDDPQAHGGYVSQYDQATGTFGLWPCIVDPNNVTTQGPPPLPPSPPPPAPPPPPPALPPPTGTAECETCDPDKEPATKWLVDAMRRNAKGPEADAIRSYEPNIWLGTLPRVYQWYLWINMVRTGADWDFKEKILFKKVGYEWGGEWVKMCCGMRNYEDFSNIHYGYVGRDVGLTDLEMLAGAGAAQWWDHHHKDGYQQDVEEGRIGLHTYYDEPEDQVGIQIGINAHIAQVITPEQFCRLVYVPMASQLKQYPHN